MVITLGPELESALLDVARRRGVVPEALAVDTLRERFLGPFPPITPSDDWERLLLGAAADCGVSLPDTALTSDGIYE